MKDIDVFDDKKFSDLLRDIYNTTVVKRKRIDDMIKDLQKHIQEASDAVVLGPIIKEYLDISIRNDEHLVKIAALIQRIITAESKGSGGGIDELLSDDEKKRLMEDAIKELENEMQVVVNEPTEPKLISTPSKVNGSTD